MLTELLNPFLLGKLKLIPVTDCLVQSNSIDLWNYCNDGSCVGDCVGGCVGTPAGGWS